MRQSLSVFLKNFCKCGLAGWCMEILFTSIGSLRRRDMTLQGSTSLWMFPIYGCAAVFAPLGRLLQKKPLWARGTAYMSLIFSLEYAAGKLLARHKSCPWDYGRSPWNIGRIIRLDFAPCWFAAGLLFERLLSPKCPEGQNRPPS